MQCVSRFQGSLPIRYHNLWRDYEGICFYGAFVARFAELGVWGTGKIFADRHKHEPAIDHVFAGFALIGVDRVRLMFR